MLSGQASTLLDANSSAGFLLVLAIVLPASGVVLLLTLGAGLRSASPSPSCRLAFSSRSS
jgi:hypothetical protein